LQSSSSHFWPSFGSFTIAQVRADSRQEGKIVFENNTTKRPTPQSQTARHN